MSTLAPQNWEAVHRWDRLRDRGRRKISSGLADRRPKKILLLGWEEDGSGDQWMEDYGSACQYVEPGLTEWEPDPPAQGGNIHLAYLTKFHFGNMTLCVDIVWYYVPQHMGELTALRRIEQIHGVRRYDGEKV